MSAEEAKKWLKSLVDFINRDAKAKEELGKWVKRYYGKILEWHVDEDKFFIILQRNSAKFADGEYPSPEVVIMLDSNAWRELAKKQHQFAIIKDWMKAEKIKVRGNLNEAYNFSKFLEVIKYE